MAKRRSIRSESSFAREPRASAQTSSFCVCECLKELTVLSRVAVGNAWLRSGAVVVHRLHLQLVESERGRSRHNKLGVVGYGHGGPVEVSGLLPPRDFVTKARPVGLEAVERLQRTQSFLNNLFFPSVYQPPAKYKWTHGAFSQNTWTSKMDNWLISFPH